MMTELNQPFEVHEFDQDLDEELNNTSDLSVNGSYHQNGKDPAPILHSDLQATDDISPEEEHQLAGFDPATPQLISEEYRLRQDEEGAVERPLAERASVRLGSVVAVVGTFIGAGAVLWFGFLQPRSPIRQATQLPTPTTPIPTFDETAELKSRLAFQDQQQSMQEDSTLSPSPPAVQSTPEPTPKATSSVSAPETIAPSPRVSYPPPPAVRESPSPPSRPVDPFERWSQLASVGQQRSGIVIESNSRDESTLAMPVNDSHSSTQELSERQLPPTAPNQSENPSTAPRPSDPVYVASAQFSEVVLGAENALDNPELSSGARGILTRTPVAQTNAAASNIKEVSLGTTINAQVIMPMVWDIGSTNDPRLQRFAVELTEDMKATDNSVALPKGTVFVAETNSVSENTNLVSASAIAVVYSDQKGNVRQEMIPAGSVLIRGEDGEALVAVGLNDPGTAIARQDLLVAILGSLGRIGEILNQPEVETRTASSDEDFAQTVISRSREPELWAAALEGFFSTTADRLSERSDQAVEELLSRPNVAVLPEETKTSIVINSTFRVAR
jgi:small nuclear ribonucleoprotein (snRNP)-like protein